MWLTWQGPVHLQYYFLQFNGGECPTERRLSYFPHPYPSIRDLQKEIVRCDQRLLLVLSLRVGARKRTPRASAVQWWQ